MSLIQRDTYAPYNRFADLNSGQPKIVLRPPPTAAPSDDPIIAAISDLQSSIDQLKRVNRLIGAPWIVEPPDAESFHQAQGILIPPEGDGAFHTVVSITVPPGRNGVLNRIANEYVGGGFVDFSGALLWRIVRNPGTGLTAAERNYENIQASLGQTQNPARIAGIRIYENDVVAIQVQNVGIVVALQTIAGLLGGWFYPRTWDDQFDRQDVSTAW